MDVANIGKVIGVLDDMTQEGVIQQFAIGGAFAAILYDEPISTIDLDIFFLFAGTPSDSILSLSAIYDYAKKRGFSFDYEFINIHGWLVQFVEASNNELWKDAIESARTLNADGLNFRVIGPEHLAAMWLFAGRPKDYQKIAQFWASNRLDRLKLVDILERHRLTSKWEQEKWRFVDEVGNG